MEWRDVAATFLLTCAVALVTMLARLGLQIQQDPPPEEPEPRAAWKRKRTWMVVGELMTLPALGVGWTAIVKHFAFSEPLIVFGGMVAGALGFGFWLAAAQRVVTRRIDNA